MSDPIAKRLWEAAERHGGAITLLDAPNADLAYARARGWLMNHGAGLFEATDELKRAAAPRSVKEAALFRDGPVLGRHFVPEPGDRRSPRG
jgi:hypothetical protein